MKLQDALKLYTPTIGIECHVQLKSKTKLFSGANNDARDAEPNTTVSPICFGLPGVLPVLNSQAIELAIRAGHALNAEVANLSRFERKHYFYPDLPKGYQITQLAEPIILAGSIGVPQVDGTTKNVQIHHAHLEEDAGKLTHPEGADYSLVDLNRAGTPLIEIVSEPDMHSAAEARAYAQELYLLMKYAEVTNGDLYHGNMRFDVNISLAPIGETTLGTRAEIKNLNSFKSVEKAAEYECVRQAEILQRGGTITQETRGWNEAKQKTISQRSKEDAHDYRYFPDADIPPVQISQEHINEVKSKMPMLPPDYRSLWAALGVDQSVIGALLSKHALAGLVTAVQSGSGKDHAKRVANWCASVLGSEKSIEEIASEPQRFVALSMMVAENKLSSTAAKEIFVELLEHDGDPEVIADQRGLLQVSDTSALDSIISIVLNDPGATKAVSDVKSGNEKAIGFLVGQVMKQSKGGANPAVVKQMLQIKLGVVDEKSSD